MPSLAELVELHERISLLARPARVVAVALNTRALDEDAARAAIAAAEAETGLPADDPVRFGSGRLLAAVRALDLTGAAGRGLWPGRGHGHKRRLDTNMCSLYATNTCSPRSPSSPSPRSSSGRSSRGRPARTARRCYRVKPYDTLWTIASSHYGGDARDGVWRIQQANHLGGATIRPGEVLVLP